MNLLLWVLQVLFGMLFLAHGLATLSWAPQLRPTYEAMPYLKGFMQFIGMCEALGGLGLVVPWWTGIAPLLTPLAAVGLAIIMLGAATTHLRARQFPPMIATTVFALLLLLIAFTRWGQGMV